MNLDNQINMYNQYKIKTEKYIIELKNKIKENELFMKKSNKNITCEEELEIKIKEINKKEKEINDKIAFLEEKEKLIDEEIKKYEKYKKINYELIIKNQQLEKDIKSKENIYNSFRAIKKS